MVTKILVVYQFATFGGVERTLLNRAEAFKYYQKNYKLFIYFYEDYGAKKSLKEYINKENLSNYIEIVDKLSFDGYDYVFMIDTPQLLKEDGIDIKELYVESHTIEKKYRKYLADCIGKVKKIVVPSKTFYDMVIEDYNIKDKTAVSVLNDFVLSDIKNENREIAVLPNWSKKIVFYFGRVDENKNVKELVKIIKSYNEKYDDEVILVVVGKIDPDYSFEQFIIDEKVGGRVVLFPPISFSKIDSLLCSLKQRQAVFVSSSKGETFSLSAAEAISMGVPCVLSDIGAHKELVCNNESFIYEIGNTSDCVKKIKNIFDNYDGKAKEIEKYREAFISSKFISDWEALLENKE